MYKKSEETKKTILEATANLIIEKNIDEINVLDVSKRANVAVGLINYHFKTKETLLIKAIEYYIKKIICLENATVLQENNLPSDKLQISLLKYSDFLARNSKMCRLFYINTLNNQEQNETNELGYEYYLPILRDMFPLKSDNELIILIYPIVCTIQTLFLKAESNQKIINFDFYNESSRHELILSLINNYIKENKE